MIHVLVFTIRYIGQHGEYFDPWRSSHGKVEPTLLRIRLHASEVVAASLTVLVASDVMETIVNPHLSIEDYVKILLVAVIRTFIAYFLALEIKELKHETHEEEEESHGHAPATIQKSEKHD